MWGEWGEWSVCHHSWRGACTLSRATWPVETPPVVSYPAWGSRTVGQTWTAINGTSSLLRAGQSWLQNKARQDLFSSHQLNVSRTHGWHRAFKAKWYPPPAQNICKPLDFWSATCNSSLSLSSCKCCVSPHVCFPLWSLSEQSWRHSAHCFIASFPFWMFRAQAVSRRHSYHKSWKCYKAVKEESSLLCKVNWIYIFVSRPVRQQGL